MGREFDKLIRDKIPEVIEQDGEHPVTHTVSGEEYENRLVDKLEEEVAEFRESGSVEELVDIIEVIDAIREAEGITTAELREMQVKKAEERGRFDEGVVLERIEDSGVDVQPEEPLSSSETK